MMNVRPFLDLTKLHPEDLDALDEDEWKQVVDADLRQGATRPPALSPLIPPALRSPHNIERFHATLTMIITSLDGQIQMREDDYESDQAALRSDILKTEFELDEARKDRSGDARELTRKLLDLRVESENLKSQYLRKRAGTMRFRSAVEETITECELLRDQLVTKLRSAIAAHRRMMKDEGIEPSSIDEDLWKVLDE